jgi:hypothetical protein
MHSKFLAGLTFGPKSALTIADEYIDNALTTYMKNHKLPVEGLPSIIEHECGFLCSAVGLLAVAAHGNNITFTLPSRMQLFLMFLTLFFLIIVKYHVGDEESSLRYINLIQSHYLKVVLICLFKFEYIINT